MTSLKPISLEKPFHIYRSSAGSGKTRTLAREYILLALKYPDYFKFILAMTFTNKSTQEMKDRVIGYLDDFRKGESEDLANEIREELGLDKPLLKLKSEEVLTGILHQYTQFSISTIDAFFQRVIRSFTRESGLLGNFRLESENDLVLSEVIAELMDELGDSNPELTDWVIRFSRERLTTGESWNITEALKKFSMEIFKDNFKSIAAEILQDRERVSLDSFLSALRKEKAIFMNHMKVPAQQALEILRSNNITSDDFSYKEVGTAIRYFKGFSNKEYVEAKPRILTSAENSASWGNSKGPRYRALTQLAESQLRPILKEMIAYDAANYAKYSSADFVEQNFYSYGLLTDILRKLKDYQAENNLMLLSDASYFLNGVINNSDTPFIYEKIGTFYRHYLIDEFQDTSELQWKNLRPLVRDALDQNNRSMVVGDVKQSVYRWRGGDLGLLQDVIEAETGVDRTEKHTLQENWRSAENLVDFNNLLFAKAAERIAEVTGHPLPAAAFGDLRQDAVRHKGKGYIRIQFFEKWKGLDEEGGAEQAMQEVPRVLEELQSKGVAINDIAILVRENKEGQQLATYLLQYKNSASAKPDVCYDVVSNEALRIDAASTVLLILSALKYVNNPDDAVARGELTYEYINRIRATAPGEMAGRFGLAGRKRMRDVLPEEFIGHVPMLLRLSLFELVETLVRIFKLGEETHELVYLQSFQDTVLEFIALGKSDIASFLEWWEEVKEKKSIQVAAHTQAAGIYTIHKAKGLQFKFVIVPFCSWRFNHTMQPLLWCKSKEKPFDQLSHVAVRYTSKLEKTFFAEDYRQEHTKIHLDNLNLLYVAFTRAEEGLIVMAPKPKKIGDKMSNAGQLVYESILQSLPLMPQFDRLKDIFTKGEIKVLSKREEVSIYVPASLKHYPANDWRKKLVIKREGAEFFQEEKSDQRKRINYGILMHRVLSGIRYKADVDDSLMKLNLEGVITEEEKPVLKQRIEAMMSHPVVGGWFGKEWQVQTEAPVIIPGGTQDRLDRVIFKEVERKGQQVRKAVIIDYKTGAHKAEDRRQVEGYAQALMQMGYVDVEGYLLYLEDLEVVPIISKTNLNLF